MRSSQSQQTLRTSIMALLFLAEGAALLALLSGYRLSFADGLAAAMRSGGGLLTLVAIGTFAATGILLLRTLRRLPPPDRRHASLTLTLNALLILTCLLVGEATLRIVHEIGMRVPQFELNLPPLRNWERTAAQFRSALSTSEPLYHDYDAEVGWVIGKNRRSQDGLYASSQEGLRSEYPGQTLLSQARAGLRLVGESLDPQRIALIGDSFTFGYEVGYQDAWGTRLATALGPAATVANFGVIGYSANQIRLRYERDIRPIQPDLVIAGFISHDFLRDSFIYNFLPYPDMLSLPYARPSPILRNGALTTQNSPLPAPDDMFRRTSLRDLPFLGDDLNYHPVEWERSAWRWFQRSFLFRAATAWPPVSQTHKRLSFTHEQQQLHRAIIRTLDQDIRRAGSTPLFVFFPKDTEMPSDTNQPPSPAVPYTVSLFRDLHIPLVDLTRCVQDVPKDRQFMPGGHYTPEANAAIAACLMTIVPDALAARTQHMAASAEALIPQLSRWPGLSPLEGHAGMWSDLPRVAMVTPAVAGHTVDQSPR